MARPRRFRVTLYRPEGTGTSTFALIPFDVAAAFGRKRAPVKGTINGFPFRSTVMVYGDEYRLVANAELRAGARAEAGDVVEGVIEADTAPRVVALPADLSAALRSRRAAAAAWRALSYSHQKEHLAWISDAKRPETRTRRIAKWLATLEAMAKRPSHRSEQLALHPRREPVGR